MFFTTNLMAGKSYSLGSGFDTLVGNKIYARLDKLHLKLEVEGEIKEATRSNPVEGSDNNTTIALGSSRVGAGGGGTVHTTWYYFKACRDGIMIRDYRPCMRRQDGKYGFFEVVSKTFCPSIGAVDFSIGPS